MSLWLFHPFIGVSMNANELADELKELSLIADNHTKIVLGIAETMLRQQALEIQALHQILGYEVVALGQDYLDECVADLRKAQE